MGSVFSHSMSDVGVLESWMSCGLMGAQNSTVLYSVVALVTAFIHDDDAVVQLQVSATAWCGVWLTVGIPTVHPTPTMVFIEGVVCSAIQSQQNRLQPNGE